MHFFGGIEKAVAISIRVLINLWCWFEADPLNRVKRFQRPAVIANFAPAVCGRIL
jgi:hypothetical protein